MTKLILLVILVLGFLIHSPGVFAADYDSMELQDGQIIYLREPRLLFHIPARYRQTSQSVTLSSTEPNWQLVFESPASSTMVRIHWHERKEPIDHKTIKLISIAHCVEKERAAREGAKSLSSSRMFYPRELEIMGARSGLMGMLILGEELPEIVRRGWKVENFAYFYQNNYLIVVSILQKTNSILKPTVEEFKTAIEKERSNSEPQFLIPKTARFFEGNVEDWKRYHKAVELWRLDKKNQKAIVLLEENPGHYESLVTIGTILGEDGIFDKAEATLEKAIALKPTKAIGYIQLLQVYLLQKKLPPVREKIAAFRKANKELNHEIDYYAGYLAYAENKRGELKSAIQNIEKYIKQDGINQLGPAPKQLELLKKYLTELKG
jgi:tetratricopeptide (TPR) repeat protein